MSGNEDCVGGFDLICRKDVSYEVEFFSGMKLALLGCKLEREKAYRALASSLNSFHKKNLNNPNTKSRNLNKNPE